MDGGKRASLTNQHLLACLQSYSHVDAFLHPRSLTLCLTHMHTLIHTGWREIEWECVLEGKPRPQSLQASVKKKITPHPNKTLCGEEKRGGIFQFSPPSASSCPARLGLWETAWHTAYQQLSHSSLHHYSGEVQCATVLTLWRRCKSVITEKHIAREIIMQHFCLWQKRQKPGDTKPRHQNNISSSQRSDTTVWIEPTITVKPFHRSNHWCPREGYIFILARQSALSVNNVKTHIWDY